MQSSLDSWPAIIAAVVAGIVSLLVPATGFLKVWFDGRAQMRQAEQLKPETAREIPGQAIGESIAARDLTEAIRDLTAAIRAETASDEAQHRDHLSQVVERLGQRLDGWDAEHGGR